MKILLDECISKRLKIHLADVDVYSVSEMGWSGLKNGKLLTQASNSGFNLLLTIDKNLQYQQNIERYNLSIFVLNVATSKVEELVTYLPVFRSKMPFFTGGNVYVLDK